MKLCIRNYALKYYIILVIVLPRLLKKKIPSFPLLTKVGMGKRVSSSHLIPILYLIYNLKVLHTCTLSVYTLTLRWPVFLQRATERENRRSIMHSCGFHIPSKSSLVILLPSTSSPTSQAILYKTWRCSSSIICSSISSSSISCSGITTNSFLLLTLSLFLWPFY